MTVSSSIGHRQRKKFEHLRPIIIESKVIFLAANGGASCNVLTARHAGFDPASSLFLDSCFPDCVVMCKVPCFVILNEVKNLMILNDSVAEILRLSPQNDITTQSLRRNDCVKIVMRCLITDGSINLYQT